MKKVMLIASAILAIFCVTSCGNGDTKTEELVDLGLSVKWATWNVGANSSEAFGACYTFDDATHLVTDGKRLPSGSEFRELIENCDYVWTEKME